MICRSLHGDGFYSRLNTFTSDTYFGNLKAVSLFSASMPV